MRERSDPDRRRAHTRALIDHRGAQGALVSDHRGAQGALVSDHRGAQGALVIAPPQREQQQAAALVQVHSGVVEPPDAQTERSARAGEAQAAPPDRATPGVAGPASGAMLRSDDEGQAVGRAATEEPPPAVGPAEADVLAVYHGLWGGADDPQHREELRTQLRLSKAGVRWQEDGDWVAILVHDERGEGYYALPNPFTLSKTLSWSLHKFYPDMQGEVRSRYEITQLAWVERGALERWFFDISQVEVGNEYYLQPGRARRIA